MDRLVIITGLSGSGKSLAARCFEDLGYYCVDNLPVLLIPPFYDLIQRSGGQIRRAALVIDVREGRFLEEFPEMLHDLRARRAPVTLIFLDCADDVLKRRFSETRRPHPMSADGVPLEEAIRQERQALARIRDLADRIVDTSRFNAHEVRAFFQASFGSGPSPEGLNVHIVSFGFKYGVPAEADLVFDVRFIPNPYFVEGLRALDGTSAEVRRFLAGRSETRSFLERITSLLDFLIPLYVAEGKSYLTVTLGCTGGKHRSVALAEDIREHLTRKGLPVVVTHRDLGQE